MRILHVNKFLYRRGGAEGYMEDVADQQRRVGHEVAFWGMEHPENVHLRLAPTFAPLVELDPPPPGVIARVRTAAHMVWSRRAARGIEAAVAEFRPDVAHLHNIAHQLTPSILRPLRAARVPTVMTAHDYKLVCPSYLMLDGGSPCDACVGHGAWHAATHRCKDGSLTASTVLAIESTVHRGLGAYDPISVILCPSHFLYEQLRRGGLAPGRLRVVSNFVDAAPVEPKSSPGGGIVVASRLSDEKGVDTVVRAAAQLPPGVPVEIAGDGPERSALEQLAGQVAPGRVRFHGRLARADLHDLIRANAVAVVPSRCNENQPMAVLEAFALGLPVVSTRLGGLPELVRDGIEGRTVPPDDPPALAAAITDVLADHDKAMAMGRDARRRVLDEFAPDRHLEAVERCYAAAIEDIG